MLIILNRYVQGKRQFFFHIALAQKSFRDESRKNIYAANTFIGWLWGRFMKFKFLDIADLNDNSAILEIWGVIFQERGEHFVSGLSYMYSLCPSVTTARHSSFILRIKLIFVYSRYLQASVRVICYIRLTPWRKWELLE